MGDMGIPTGLRPSRSRRRQSLPPKLQLFNLQWLAHRLGGSLLRLFTRGLRCRLFINQSFFEQLSPIGAPHRGRAVVLALAALTEQGQAVTLSDGDGLV
jgi:hypothetical protein